VKRVARSQSDVIRGWAARRLRASFGERIRRRLERNRKLVDSLLEGDGFELAVREHRDTRMRSHLVVNHRVAAHVPVLALPWRREQQQIGAVAGSGSPTASVMIWALLIIGTGSKLRQANSFRAAAGLR
jgi:hypothetical protein